MGGRSASLLALTLVAFAVGVGPTAGPASADTNICSGWGVVSTGPLVAPVTTSASPLVTVSPPRTVPVQFAFGGGACVPDLAKAFTFTGILTGWCGHFVGYASTSQGHGFTFTSAGNAFAMSGDVAGLGLITTDPMVTGNSCYANPGATQFLLAFTGLLYHCSLIEHWVSTGAGVPATLTTVAPVASVHTGGSWSYVATLCL